MTISTEFRDQLRKITKQHAQASPHDYARDAAQPDWLPHDWVIYAMADAFQRGALERKEGETTAETERITGLLNLHVKELHGARDEVARLATRCEKLEGAIDPLLSLVKAALLT